MPQDDSGMKTTRQLDDEGIARSNKAAHEAAQKLISPRYNKETMKDPEDLAIENVEKDPAGPIKERANKVARAQAATAMQRKNNPNNAFVKKP